MRVFIPLLSLFLLVMCKSSHDHIPQLYDLGSATDAFDYPNLDHKADTDIYVYQLKGILNQRDSFLYVQYGMSYLKKFNEENLSLRPAQSEIFRFSYCPFSRKPLNITFTHREIIVKLGLSGTLEPVYDYSKLDSTELKKLMFLDRNYFRPKETSNDRRSRYCDSMERKYPELKSIAYYKQLLNKSWDNDSLKFKYVTNRIPLTETQYNLLLDSLKNSNFNLIPWRIKYPESVADGGGYTFEANTKNRFKFFVCYGLPIDTLPMTNFCRYLIKVAHMDKEIKL